jgi:secreted trypsin-like serine protease
MAQLKKMISAIFFCLSIAPVVAQAEIAKEDVREIVGGELVTDTSTFEYKHTVRLLVKGTLSGEKVPDQIKGLKMSWRCSGALLNKTVVVSAAHCFPSSIGISDPNTGELIRADMTDLSAEVFFKTDTRADRPWGIKSKKIVVHEGFRDDWYSRVQNVWNPTESVHDLALVKLAEEAPSDKEMVAVIEEKEAQMSAGEELVLAGYGRDITDDQVAIPRLRRVSAPWREKLNNGSEWYVGHGDLVRAGRVDRPAGGCVGDSGGPVYVKRANRIRLAGVIVRGPDEANGGCRAAVTIVTALPTYGKWLREKLVELSRP